MSFLHNPEVKRDIVIWIIAVVAISAFALLFGVECFVFTLCASLVYCIFHFASTYRRYKCIYELTSSVDKVLHGSKNIDFSGFSEGELSVLSNEIQKMTHRLNEQNELLIRKKKHLSDSIADISHQIRTPLTSLNLIVARLSDENLTSEKKLLLTQDMFRLLSKMDWLVTSLLKISKLDADSVKFSPCSVVALKLIESVVSTVAVQLDLRGFSVEQNVQNGASIICDTTWTQEALVNIVKNCMEHSQDGSAITINVRETPIFSEIIIEDNGSGIDKDDLPHIFERFYKGKNSSSSSVGIGLYLTRSIIQRQNGTIKAENKESTGARFIIRFYKSVT